LSTREENIIGEGKNSALFGAKALLGRRIHVIASRDCLNGALMAW
jgi:hypothetical protein